MSKGESEAAKLPPGPWRWEAGRLLNADGGILGASWDTRGPYGVTHAYVVDEDGELRPDDALARAIAALPELVEALERIIAEQEGRDMGDAFCATEAREALEKAGLR